MSITLQTIGDPSEEAPKDFPSLHDSNIQIIEDSINNLIETVAISSYGGILSTVADISSYLQSEIVSLSGNISLYSSISLASSAQVNSFMTTYANWAISGTNIYKTNAGNVGIGTASPEAGVHIKAALATARLEGNHTGTDDYVSYIQFNNSASSPNVDIARIISYRDTNDDSGGIIIQTTNNQAIANALIIDKDGDIDLLGSLILSKNLTVSGSSLFIGAITAQGEVTLNDGITANAEAIFNGRIIANNETTFNDGITANAEAIFNGRIIANNETTFNDGITANAEAIFNGRIIANNETTFNDGITANAEAIFNGRIIANNETTFNDGITANAESIFNGIIIANNETTFNDGITANAEAIFNGRIVANNETTFNDGITANAEAIFNGRIVANNETTFNDGITANAEAIFNGRIIANNETTFNDGITANAEAIFNGRIVANNETTFNDGITANAEAIFNGRIIANNETTFNDGITANSEAIFNGRIVANNETTFNDGITANAEVLFNGTTTLDGQLIANNESTFNDGITANAEVLFNSTLNVNGITTLEGKLIANDETTFNNGVTANGEFVFFNNVEFDGYATFNNRISANNDAIFGGKIGIGTAAPTVSLTVKSPTDTSPFFLEEYNSNNGWRLFSSSISGDLYISRYENSSEKVTLALSHGTSANADGMTLYSGFTQYSGTNYLHLGSNQTPNDNNIVGDSIKGYPHLWLGAKNNVLIDPDSGVLTSYATTNEKPGGGSWDTISDIRLKTNIAPLSGSLDLISRLSGKSFNWATDNSFAVSFIAQEIEEVFPQWISTRSPTDKEKPFILDGDKVKLLSLKSDFSVHLVEAIKELKTKNEALEARILKLENS